MCSGILFFVSQNNLWSMCAFDWFYKTQISVVILWALSAHRFVKRNNRKGAHFIFTFCLRSSHQFACCFVDTKLCEIWQQQHTHFTTRKLFEACRKCVSNFYHQHVLYVNSFDVVVYVVANLYNSWFPRMKAMKLPNLKNVSLSC